MLTYCLVIHTQKCSNETIYSTYLLYYCKDKFFNRHCKITGNFWLRVEIKSLSKFVRNQFAGAENTGGQVICALYRSSSHHSRERMYTAVASRGYAVFGSQPGGWSVQSYRLAACLNVLRRVYSSYQFPGKYLHFRAPTFSLFYPMSFSALCTPARNSIARYCGLVKDANRTYPRTSRKLRRIK